LVGVSRRGQAHFQLAVELVEEEFAAVGEEEGAAGVVGGEGEVQAATAGWSIGRGGVAVQE
jgi:hypothetical protein